MNNFAKRIEMCGNIAIVIVAVMVIGFMIDRLVIHPAKSDNRSNIKVISAGTKVSLPNMDWRKNGNTLLLVVAKGCHFCSESAPFYQRLVQEMSGRNDVRIVALVPQDEAEGRSYLSDLKVPITDVRHASLEDIGVPGTPTMILVNASGTATKVWVGQLPLAKEAEVFSALKSNGASS